MDGIDEAPLFTCPAISALAHPTQLEELQERYFEAHTLHKEFLSEIFTPPPSTLINSILNLPSGPLPRAISSLQLHLAHHHAKVASFPPVPAHHATKTATHNQILPSTQRKLHPTRPDPSSQFATEDKQRQGPAAQEERDDGGLKP